MKSSVKANAAYLALLLMIATATFIFYLALATQNHFAQLEPMIYGAAPRPYAYRVLTPFIIRLLLSVTGVSPFSAAALVMYAALLGFTLSIAAFLKLFLAPRPARIFALLAPVGLIPLLLEQRHIYDFPTLFLFTLALYFLAREDFPKYIFVFILATLSKETSLFLLFFFVVQFKYLARKKFLLLAALQLAVYACVRLLFIFLFKDNPGGVAIFHLYEHATAYAHRPWIAGAFFCAIFAAVALLPFAAREDKSNFARNSLIAIGGPTLILYFFFGMPFEVRVFMETYPSLYLTACFAALFLIERVGGERRENLGQ